MLEVNYFIAFGECLEDSSGIVVPFFVGIQLVADKLKSYPT